MSLVVGSVTSNVVRIGYENLFESASTVVASSEDADFPVENAYDWITTDFFNPASVASDVTITLTFGSSVDADYFAIYAHNLDETGGTYKLQYWDGATWQDAFSVVTPTNGKPRMNFFTSQTSTQWRVVFTATSIFSVGVISFGARLTFENGIWQGFTPPPFADNSTLLTSISDNGAFIGRSVTRNGVRFTIPMTHASLGWMRSDWQPFLEHALTKPFFFSWDASAYPTEVAYCWCENSIGTGTNTHHNRMAHELQVEGMINDL